jgi:hypothetical protein
VDGKISEEHGLDISFAFIEGTPSSMRQLRDTITEAELRRLALPSVVNQTIDSGRSKSFVMYLRMRDRNGASLEGTQVLFSCNAVFSDGTKHHIAQGIGFND